MVVVDVTVVAAPGAADATVAVALASGAEGTTATAALTTPGAGGEQDTTAQTQAAAWPVYTTLIKKGKESAKTRPRENAAASVDDCGLCASRYHDTTSGTWTKWPEYRTCSVGPVGCCSL